MSRSRPRPANRRGWSPDRPIALPAPRREATPESSQPRCGWNRPNKIPSSCKDAGPWPTAAAPAPIAIGESSFPLTLDFSPLPKPNGLASRRRRNKLRWQDDAGLLAAGQARVRSIAKGFCDERATRPAAKRTSQVAAIIYLRLLGPGSLRRSHPGFIVPQNSPPLRHSEWRRGSGRGGVDLVGRSLPRRPNFRPEPKACLFPTLAFGVNRAARFIAKRGATLRTRNTNMRLCGTDPFPNNATLNQ